MSDEIPEILEPPKKPRPIRPNAWKAGRKPEPKGKRSRRKGTDECGGEVAIRADSKLAVPERNDPAYQSFSERVGGVEGLKELAAWSENPKAVKLFQLIDDGRFKAYGIKALAKRVGMTLPELCNLFREKHFLEMYLDFFEGIPEIARGTIQDAQPSTDVCPMCHGERDITRGKITRECPKCDGRGKVRVPGDKEARRDIFRTVGLVKDTPAIVQNVTIEGVDNFEDLMRSAKSTPIQTTPKKVEDAQEAEVIQD